jgi:hypothetical protein
MSDDGSEWFAPKRYGFGAGLPISWQGWAITIGFLAMSIALALVFATRPLLFIAAVIPITATFLVIAAKTTRGGWRWRWGKED